MHSSTKLVWNRKWKLIITTYVHVPHEQCVIGTFLPLKDSVVVLNPA